MERPKIDPQSSVTSRKDGTYYGIAKAYQEAGICVFCDLSEQFPITESDNGTCILLANRYPRSTGDLLISTKRHVENIDDLTPDEVLAVHQLGILGRLLLRKTFGIQESYTLTRRGGDASVKHYHTHIQPYRREGVIWVVQDDLLSPQVVAPKIIATLEEIKKGNG